VEAQDSGIGIVGYLIAPEHDFGFFKEVGRLVFP